MDRQGAVNIFSPAQESGSMTRQENGMSGDGENMRGKTAGPTADETGGGSKRRDIILNSAGIGLIVLISLFVYLFIDQSILREIKGPGGYGILFLLELLFTSSIFFPLPADPLILLAGGMLDPLAAGLVAGTAASLGECTAYIAGAGGRAILYREGRNGRLEKVRRWFGRYGFPLLPIFAFTPLPCDLIGIVAGMVRYDMRKFLLGMLIGKIPRALLLAGAGSFGEEWLRHLIF